MSSDKQLILIIITAVAVLGYQWYKDKKKNDYCCTNQLKDSIENTFKMWGY